MKFITVSDKYQYIHVEINEYNDLLGNVGFYMFIYAERRKSFRVCIFIRHTVRVTVIRAFDNSNLRGIFRCKSQEVTA